ncbi:uncharacterized protein LOC134241886 [Saccostrea cucullata]|uniref:uncharacterized protein LOC134241886 n=1 Tax=Saccostrea cuccullata TaxID=36930 RepID=UPI002ED20491
MCDCVNSLFYTSSTENDYPRIGKRQNSLHTDVWMTTDNNFEGSEEIIDSSNIPNIKTHTASTTSFRSRRVVGLLFKLLDRNGDEFISRTEFNSNAFTNILDVLSSQRRKK